MATTLTLTFESAPIVAGRAIFVNMTSPLGSLTPKLELFDVERFDPGTAAQGVDTATQAQNFAIAWNLDYSAFGGTGNLIAIPIGNVVTITCLNPSWQFEPSTGSAITSGQITESINNDTPEDEKSVEVTGYASEPGSECASIRANLEITGGTAPYKIYSLGGALLKSGVAASDYLTVDRNIATSVNVIDDNSETIGAINISPPKKILEENISVILANYSTGTTMTINVSTSLLNKPLQYSLDNVTYQSENVYTGLPPATYTLYVKDVFGCVTTKASIVVDGVTEIVETIFSLSEINALRYARVESGKKNHKNTLSCNEVRQVRYPFFHRFLNTDIVPTQFKTNAQYIRAYTIDSSGNENTLTHVSKTENIGLTSKSTCTLFSLGGGRSAIYFGLVDILNPLNDDVIEQKDFGFTLPEWADTVGDRVVIDGIGELPIDALGYSDDYDSFVIELNYAFYGIPTTKKLSASYNLQPYEVYEFSFDMNAESPLFNVVIEAGTDSNNIDFCFISEKVKKVTDSDYLAEINYYDSKNKGGMVYQTGIKHLLRLPYFEDYIGEQKTEGYNGDSEYYVTDNVIYDAIKWTFPRLTGEMCAKMRLVCAHEYLEINGIFYKLSEAPDIKTNPNNNQKTFSVVLKRSGDQFLTDEQEQISDAQENAAISAAIEASKGKALILWTKTNG